MEVSHFLHRSLQTNQLMYPPEVENAFLHYLELMQKWNRVYNLTAITDLSEMVKLHIVDSLVINPYLHGDRILDAGTGAGLPGIPLALVNPNKQFVLLDSNSKKIRFLIQVIHELNLKNVDVVHSRLEDFHPNQCFDSILTRAFAAIKVMLEVTKHLICPDGVFLAMKGIYPEKELAEIPSEFTVVNVHELKIQGLNAKRHLICIKGNR